MYIFVISVSDLVMHPCVLLTRSCPLAHHVCVMFFDASSCGKLAMISRVESMGRGGCSLLGSLCWDRRLLFFLGIDLSVG